MFRISCRRHTSRTKCASLAKHTSRSTQAEHLVQKSLICPVDKLGFFVGRGRRIPYSALLRSKFVLRSTTAFCGSKNDNLAPPAALRLAASRTKPHTKQKSPSLLRRTFLFVKGGQKRYFGEFSYGLEPMYIK